jgi:hypothetical protein
MQITRIHGYQISYKTRSGERARFVNFSQTSLSELKFIKKLMCYSFRPRTLEDHHRLRFYEDLTLNRNTYKISFWNSERDHLVDVKMLIKQIWEKQRAGVRMDVSRSGNISGEFSCT